MDRGNLKMNETSEYYGYILIRNLTLSVYIRFPRRPNSVLTEASFFSEPVVSCPMKTPKKRPESAAATICSNKDDRNTKNVGQTNTTRRPCGTCCSTARSRKFTDSSMFLLLRQGDAGNLRGPDERTTVCQIPPLPKFGA